MSTEIFKTAFTPAGVLDSVEAAIETNPNTRPTFDAIAKYIVGLQDGTESRKKRKLTLDIDDAKAVLVINDLSFLSPLRKKLTLVITDSTISGISNHGSDDAVIGAQISWSDVQSVACLPVPDRVSPQWNFIVFPARTPGAVNIEYPEAIVFSVGESHVATVCELVDLKTHEFIKDGIIEVFRRIRPGLVINQPTTKDFESSKDAPNPKNSTRSIGNSVSVAAHRGPKDGHMFFLKNKILFGFRKPIVLIDISEIQSISYSSITRLTYSLLLTLANGQSIEFSMIDQKEHEGIDRYLNSKHLLDTSMSEENRATKDKKIKSEQVKSSELAKAEQEYAKLHPDADDYEEGLVQVKTPPEQDDDDDEEDDEDFNEGSESDGGSPNSDSESEDEQ